MLRIIPTVLFCAVLIFTVPAFAQSGAVSVDQKNLSELIETLESARTEFIENLKTLKETRKEGEEEKAAPASLSEIFGVEEQISGIAKRYRQFLADNNLSNSALGKTGLTLGSMIVFLLLGLLVRKGGTALRDYLLRMKNRFGLTHNRFRHYARIVRYSGYTLLTAFFLYSLGVIWDISDFGFLKTEGAIMLLGEFLSVLLVVLMALVLWEVINGFIEFGLLRADRNASNRLRTLLPIIRNVMFVIFAILFTLVLLSELGIDIVPLLAGAGIFGIAVGFGAQTMVKDFLTGFTIILEDLIQVGDVAKLGGRTGIIEKITIRKVQMRDLDGTVYTIPFSQIDIVDNLTKEYSYYLMDVGVAYREDPDEVIGYLQEIDEDLRGDANYKDLILEPLEILGVDQFADSAVIIKARIKTRPIWQWDVGREFNRRMKYKFDEKGVEIPFPHQTLYFGEDKEGNAPPAPVLLKGTDKLENAKGNKKASRKKNSTNTKKKESTKR